MNSINYTAKRNYNGYLLGLFAVILCIMTLLFSDFEKESVFQSLDICYKVIIPSMFTYMCISNILIKSGVDAICAKLFGKAFQKLFHLPSCYCCAYFISLICGYAQGANSVDKISQKEETETEFAEKALILCSNPSPSFLIIGLGHYLNSPTKGLILYIISIAVSFLYSLFTRPKECSFRYDKIEYTQNKDILTSSVSSSVKSTINICGYIVFFGVICNYIKMIISVTGMPEISIAVIFSIIELTNFTALLENNAIPLFLTAFACTWSGICVHLQIKALAPKIFKYREFAKAKLIQAVVTAVLIIFLQIT